MISRMVWWLYDRVEDAFGKYSRIGDAPFFPTDVFPWSQTLESNWQTIRAELDGVLAYRDDLPNFQDFALDCTIDDDRWKTFFFRGYGFRSDENCQRCPQTAKLLDGIPGVTTAFFSILRPHKNIPPHDGPYKGVIRYHLGLKVPEPPTSCGIRVAGEVAHWEEGRGLALDDTFQHEAWNDGDSDRVVLFLDVLRPLPLPLALVNRAIVRAIGLSPWVRQAKGNHVAWESKFEQLLAARAS